MNQFASSSQTSTNNTNSSNGKSETTMALLSELVVHWPTSIIVGSVLYWVLLVLYRITLHPLAKFPGPKLAGATLWYEGYYDVIKRGRYVFKIKELHEQYGPIIRISPEVLHIDDPEYYDVLYSRSSPRNKYSFWARMLGNPRASVGTVDHYRHRLLRQPLSPFFSKASINRLEPAIHALVEKVCNRLEEYKNSGEIWNALQIYLCLTTDVLTQYSFNNCWNLLDSPDMGLRWHEGTHSTETIMPVMAQFPWIHSLLDLLPDWITVAVPEMADFMKVKRNILETVKSTLQDEKDNIYKGEERHDQTVFQALLRSNLSEEDKSLRRMWQEGIVIIAGGAKTTASALAHITFHILNNPAVLQKLRKELSEAIPNSQDPITLKAVERLPYLSAIILEGLSYGITGRLPRIAPKETLKYNEWSIPQNTPVCIDAVAMHDNESIFPDPHTFLPERWSDLPDSGRALERYLVSFSKGSRMCIGINLAKAELYLTLATVFRRFDLELYDTTWDRDVKLHHDYFSAHASTDSKGIRIVCK